MEANRHYIDINREVKAMRVIGIPATQQLGSEVLSRLHRLALTCALLESKAVRLEQSGETEMAESFYRARNRTSDRMTDLFSLYREFLH